MRRLIQLLVVALCWTAASASANDCFDCKRKCREQQQQCRDAGGPLCETGVGGPVCEIFENFHCPNKEKACLHLNCEFDVPDCDANPLPGFLSGEPHLSTFDRTSYDLQAVGEFVAARSESADVEMQVRMGAYGQSKTLAVVTAFAIGTGGHTLTFRAGAAPRVDGISLADDFRGGFVAGNLYLERQPGRSPVYLFTVGDVLGRVQLWSTTMLNVYVSPGSTRGWVGLLGDADGSPDNDLVSRAGKAFDRKAMTHALLYDEFAKSWRVRQDESILPYDEGETTATFTDLDFPEQTVQLASLDAEAFEKARAACLAAHVHAGAALDDCIYDVAFAGDASLAGIYANRRSADASAVFVAGEANLRAQKEVTQGALVDVYWSGSALDKVKLTLVDGAGKRIVSPSLHAGSPTRVRMPADVGDYTFVLTDGETTQRHDIVVEPAKASLTAPATVPGAQRFELSWTGPGESGEYIALVDRGKQLTYLWASSESKRMKAPAKAGRYELEYRIQGATGKRAIARATLEVEAATATLSAPDEVEAGAMIPVAWTGPGESDDFIEIAATATDERLSYVWIADETEEVRAPPNPGTAHLRYVVNAPGGRTTLATRSIKVTDVSAAITAPAAAAPGEKIKLSWTGPNRSGDFITIVGAGKSERRDEPYVWASRGKGTLKVPANPGANEIIYILQGAGGRRVLARQPITITAP